MNFEIIDDFLPKSEFKNIQSVMMGTYFPWYWNEWAVKPGDNKSQLTHTFHSVGSPWNGRVSEFYELFDNVQRKLRVKKLYRIKANLNYKTFFHRKAGYHIDTPGTKTAILYINTNNGGTKFKNGKIVRSVENRLVLFDLDLQHAGVTCTDQKRRVVVNLNYLS